VTKTYISGARKRVRDQKRKTYMVKERLRKKKEQKERLSERKTVELGILTILIRYSIGE